MLEDDAGLSLGVSNLFGSAAPAYPIDFHIGFILTSETELHDVYERLVRGGVHITKEPSRGGPNIYFMCSGPDGVTIEIRAPTGEAAA